MQTRLTPQALQPGSSFCLPFLTPFKGVSMPLEDGAARVDLGHHWKSLRKPSLKIHSWSEHKIPI